MVTHQSPCSEGSPCLTKAEGASGSLRETGHGLRQLSEPTSLSWECDTPYYCSLKPIIGCATKTGEARPRGRHGFFTRPLLSGCQTSVLLTRRSRERCTTHGTTRAERPVTTGTVMRSVARCVSGWRTFGRCRRRPPRQHQSHCRRDRRTRPGVFPEDPSSIASVRYYPTFLIGSHSLSVPFLIKSPDETVAPAPIFCVFFFFLEDADTPV